jgi:hypothetical protein
VQNRVALAEQVRTLAEKIATETGVEDIDWDQVGAWIDELATLRRAASGDDGPA